MGAHDAVVASSTQMQGALLVDREGNVINRMTGDEFGHRVGGDLEIVRGKLFEILMARTAGVDVMFGHAIASIAQSCDGVEVTFRNGDARTFDLVMRSAGGDPTDGLCGRREVPRLPELMPEAPDW
jgi:2-polyprenyl-6-methoxyphenol hydroxylase-like FAD-dependent oxidoreductase